jgi:hypothetical protein
MHTEKDKEGRVIKSPTKQEYEDYKKHQDLLRERMSPALKGITPESKTKFKIAEVDTLPEYQQLSFQQKRQYLIDKGLRNELRYTVGGSTYSIGSAVKSLTDKNLDKTNHLEIIERYLSRHRSGGGKSNGHGLSGRGLTKSRIRVEGSVVKPARYIPFGRYVINKQKLADDILMIKTPRGAVIPEMPSHKISSKLSQLFKTVAGGGIPEYDDIDSLKDEDKDHFVKVLKRCHIDHVSLPKGRIEPDTDRFDVLKGELLAGQNNPQVIKEFKVMLLKYIHSGRIPRREGHEILTDLTAMGF